MRGSTPSSHHCGEVRCFEHTSGQPPLQTGRDNGENQAAAIAYVAGMKRIWKSQQQNDSTSGNWAGSCGISGTARAQCLEAGRDAAIHDELPCSHPIARVSRRGNCRLCLVEGDVGNGYGTAAFTAPFRIPPYVRSAHVPWPDALEHIAASSDCGSGNGSRQVPRCAEGHRPGRRH